MEQLLLGATLFKIGLILLGLFVIGLARTSTWTSVTPRQRPVADPRPRFTLAILAVILLAAFFLRLHRLDSGLWLDEILTHVWFAKAPFGEILTTYHSENQHFLYSLLAHASFLLFDESAWSLRFPAVLFGVGSIWGLYLLGRQVATTREALLASALMTVSYHHVWFSQNARGYTGLLFWTILASWLLLRGLREGRPHLWLLYAAAAALGVYTHLTMLFVIISHFIIYLIAFFARPRPIPAHRWTGVFIGFCLAGLLILQLHAIVLPQMFGGIAATKSVVTAWKDPLWTLLEFRKGMQLGFAGSLAATAALLVFGAGLLSFARTNPMVLYLLAIPPLTGAVVVIGMGHHLWPRFFFFAMGFGILVVIRGAIVLGDLATRLFSLATPKPIPIGTALAMGIIFFSMTSLPSVYGPKQDYLGALAFVESRKEPGDTIVTVGLATFPYKYFYKRNWESAESLDALNAIRARSKRTWLLYTLPPVLQSVYPEIMTSIGRDFDVVKQFHGTLREGIVFVTRSDIPPSRPARTGRTLLEGGTFEVRRPDSEA